MLHACFLSLLYNVITIRNRRLIVNHRPKLKCTASRLLYADVSASGRLAHQLLHALVLTSPVTKLSTLSLIYTACLNSTLIFNTVFVTFALFNYFITESKRSFWWVVGHSCESDWIAGERNCLHCLNASLCRSCGILFRGLYLVKIMC